MKHLKQKLCMSGKRKFLSREQAEGAAIRERVPLRIYKCPSCKGYHLTSQNLRPRDHDFFRRYSIWS